LFFYARLILHHEIFNLQESIYEEINDLINQLYLLVNVINKLCIFYFNCYD